LNGRSKHRRTYKGFTAHISRDSPFYAKQFVERILLAVEKLQRHPNIDRVVPEAYREDVRELLFHNYRIMYVIKAEYI
jgi:plasmid stabilization system protein ParE